LQEETKDLAGSELKQIKILTQPTKMRLFADFFNAIAKNQDYAKIKLDRAYCKDDIYTPIMLSKLRI